ncbi:MAG: hypothetical protein EXS36_18110 [Pedosphaera sp.]|nr:hypothetical protein [Pedosphaera sp.]
MSFEKAEDGGVLARVWSGLIGVLNRDRSRRMGVGRSSSAAALDTEYQIAATEDGRVDLRVFEGTVELTTPDGRESANAGQQLSAGSGRISVITPGIDAVNSIQWRLYYPGILHPADLGLSARDATPLRESLAAYDSGDLVGALAELPSTGIVADPNSRIYLAAVLLAVGAVGDAEAELKTLATVSPIAEALRQVIAAVNFQEFRRQTSPATATEWLADSYYQQSRASVNPKALEAARSAARMAAALAPESGFARARVAEMEFSFSETSAARNAVEAARRLSPRNAEALSLKGFVLAAQNRIPQAKEHFERAIATDGALGNAWLGRGLCSIRQGNTKAGRADLLTAAALEPQRSLFRSYLFKILSDLGEDRRAAVELARARELDPNDPTSWLYGALHKDGLNQLNRGIADLEIAQTLSDNRAVFRSGLLLDQDGAVLSANLARLYRDAGMPEVRLREAIRAVDADYANYSAHLFLANSYFALRDPNLFSLRYDTPAFSEYLLANLLAPVGAGTLSPTISQQEYGKLFAQDGLGAITESEYLSRGAWTIAGSQFGTFGNSSYALEGFYRNDPGERINSDVEQREISLQWKQQLTPANSLLLRVSDFESHGGDLFPTYDPTTANPLVRFEHTQQPLVTIGFNHIWRPSVQTLLLASALQEEIEYADSLHQALIVARQPGGVFSARPLGMREDFANRLEQYSVELQQIWTQGPFRTVAGVGKRWGSLRSRSRLTFPEDLAGWLPDPPSDVLVSDDVSRINGYIYETWTPVHGLSVQADVAYDWQRFPVNHRVAPLHQATASADHVLPKVGAIWTPWQRGVVRAAYAQSASSGGFNPTPQLEPTHVSGFIQSYRNLIPETFADTQAGSRMEITGVSLEQRLSTGIYLGVSGELLRSHAPRAIGGFFLYFDEAGDLADVAHPEVVPQDLQYRERALTLTPDQPLGDLFTVGASYRLQEARLGTVFGTLPDLSAAEPPFATSTQQEAVLHQVVGHLNFNHPAGWFSTFLARWMDQTNKKDDAMLAGDSTWQLDLWLGYRWRHRRAEAAVGILNLLDDDHRLNPLNSFAKPPRERTVALRLGLRF